MSLSLMHVGVSYLTLGVVVTAGLWLAGRAQRRSQPTRAATISAMDPARASAWYRFLDIVLLPLIFLALVALLWPLALYAQFRKPWWMRGGPSSAREPDPEFAVRAEHLLDRLTVEQIEAREQVDDPLAAVPALPFGHLNAPWRRLLDQRTEGDEFWSFRALWIDSLRRKEDRRGYALVREGVVVAWMHTSIVAVADEAG